MTSGLEPPCRNEPSWSRSRASWIQWLTWSWANDLLKVGFKRELVIDDIDSLDEYHTSKYLLNRFAIAWQKQSQTNPSNPNLYLAIIDAIKLKRFILIETCNTRNI